VREGAQLTGLYGFLEIRLAASTRETFLRHTNWIKFHRVHAALYSSLVGLFSPLPGLPLVGAKVVCGVDALRVNGCRASNATP